MPPQPIRTGTAVSELLKTAIRDRGRIEGDLVMVDGFLNHRVELGLMSDIGRFLAVRLGPVDAVVTSEASGIAPAYATADALAVPLVFAKKRPAPSQGTIARRVRSPTKGDRPWLELAPITLAGLSGVAIVDDFLSAGRTALALGEMMQEAGVAVTGMGFAIEKAYAGGRRLLESAGFRVVAAATIAGIENGRPDVR